ncbi:F-box domain-containing protein [Artemisia annua]|uniref:F-box domain-containing protein n=1 Tax=Artemisia annua TaxID=35608 RepID=A0A2U1QME4_ARTAN|nr:F-box domain-containing protein [Artemisia annua]
MFHPQANPGQATPANAFVKYDDGVISIVLVTGTNNKYNIQLKVEGIEIDSKGVLVISRASLTDLQEMVNKNLVKFKLDFSDLVHPEAWLRFNNTLSFSAAGMTNVAITSNHNTTALSKSTDFNNNRKTTTTVNDKAHFLVRIRDPLEHQEEAVQVSVAGTFNGIVLLAYIIKPSCRTHMILYNPLTCASKLILEMDPPSSIYLVPHVFVLDLDLGNYGIDSCDRPGEEGGRVSASAVAGVILLVKKVTVLVLVCWLVHVNQFLHQAQTMCCYRVHGQRLSSITLISPLDIVVLKN